MEDYIQWIATYKDGTTLHQIESEGHKHAYSDIDRADLVSFSLYVKPPGLLGAPDGMRVFSCHFDGDGEKLIWRRRVQHRDGADPLIVHVVGKKGRYVALVEQMGTCNLFDNFNEQDALLAFPQPVEGEE